jgi:hypothetical protein
MKDKALDAVNRGLENIPSYDAPGRSRLAMSLQQIEAITDGLKVDEETAPSTPTEPAPAAN